MGRWSRLRRKRKRTQPEQPWWERRGELLSLYEWLNERGESPAETPDGVVYFLEKPWKWEEEHDLYLRWLSGERCPADDCPFLPDECPSREIHHALA